MVPECVTGLLFALELAIHFFSQQNRYDAIFQIHAFLKAKVHLYPKMVFINYKPLGFS